MLIVVDSAVLAAHAEDEERDENAVERDYGDPEVHLALEVAQHATGPLGEPVGHARVEPNYGDGPEGVVEVSHHKVGVVEVDVRSTGTEMDASYSSDEEFSHESEGPQHGCGEADGSAVQGGDVKKAKLCYGY